MQDERHDLAWAEERFSAALDGELGADERRVFDALLARDASVRAAFDSFRRSVNRLQQAGPRAVPAGFGADVRRAVTATMVAAPRRRSLDSIVAWVIAATAACVAIWAWLDRPEPERVEVPVEVRIRVEVPVEVPVPIEVRVPVDRPVVEERIVERVVARTRIVAVPTSIDTAPLAAGLGRFVNWLDSRARVSPPVAAPVPDRPTEVTRAKPSLRPASWPAELKPRRLESVPIAVVREADGTVHLDLAGRDDETIPELLLLVDDSRAEVSALAEDALTEIQTRLTTRHEIPPPIAAAEPSRAGRGAGLRRLFRGGASSVEKSASAQWSEWWEANRTRIQAVSRLGSE